MECLGSFAAQYYAFLSFDPNTIFQFYVFPDRLFLVKVGSALNQIPRVVLGSALVPKEVGLRDPTEGVLPSLEQARKLVQPPSKKAWFKLESSSVANEELFYSDIESCRYRRKGLAREGLTIKPRSKKKLSFTFLEGTDVKSAVRLLRSAMQERFEVPA